MDKEDILRIFRYHPRPWYWQEETKFGTRNVIKDAEGAIIAFDLDFGINQFLCELVNTYKV